MPPSFTLLITHSTTNIHTLTRTHMNTYICSLRFCIGHSSSFTSCNGWRRQLRLPHRNTHTHAQSHTTRCYDDACRQLKTKLFTYYTRKKCNWKFGKLLKRSYSTAVTAAAANAAAVAAATAWRCCSPTKYTNFCSYTRSPRHTR